MMAKVAFLGLGVMGYPMAGHLKAKGGHEVTVYNRSAAKADKWVAQYGGRGPATAHDVNQICIAGLVQGLAEGLSFAKKSGLDIEKLIATISKGAARSWQMENRYKTMAAGKYDFGFAVDWMRKDLAICMAEAKRNGAQLPVTTLVDQF